MKQAIESSTTGMALTACIGIIFLLSKIEQSPEHPVYGHAGNPTSHTANLPVYEVDVYNA